MSEEETNAPAALPNDKPAIQKTAEQIRWERLAKAARKDIESYTRRSYLYTILLTIPVIALLVVWFLPGSEKAAVALAEARVQENLALSESAAVAAKESNLEAAEALLEAGLARASADRLVESIAPLEAALSSGRVEEVLIGTERLEQEIAEVRNRALESVRESAELRKAMGLGLDKMSEASARMIADNRDLASALGSLKTESELRHESLENRVAQLERHLRGLEPSFYRSLVVPEDVPVAVPGFEGLILTVSLSEKATAIRIMIEDTSGALGQATNRSAQLGVPLSFTYSNSEYQLVVKNILRRWAWAKDFVQVDILHERFLPSTSSEGEDPESKDLRPQE